MDKEQARIIISLMLEIAKESVSTDTTNADALEFALKAIDMMPTTTTNNNEPIYINYPLITCDDAVSRENVKRIYVYSRLIMKGKLGNIYFLKKLNELPPVTPSRQWIPVSERLPEDAYGCLVTVYDTDLRTQDEFENILPYTVGYDGETWNNADGNPIPFEVIAWMPLPKPYESQESEE